MAGFQSPHKLLNRFIEDHTGCLPGDTGLPFVTQESDLRIEISLMSFEWDRFGAGELIRRIPILPSDVKQIRMCTRKRHKSFNPT